MRMVLLRPSKYIYDEMGLYDKIKMFGGQKQNKNIDFSEKWAMVYSGRIWTDAEKEIQKHDKRRNNYYNFYF